MINKSEGVMKKISNPLTMIAIFAGIAEMSAMYVLPQLPSNIQETFVYFVMIFPFTLVSFFFYTLTIILLIYMLLVILEMK